MKPDIKKKWVEALRSGKYKQGRSQLKRIQNGKVTHCCLGVLCEIIAPDHEEIKIGSYRIAIIQSDQTISLTGWLSSELLNAVEMSWNDQKKLMQMNDTITQPYSFDDIADYIEENL